MKIVALAHVCLHSRDLAATEAFYCGALGLGVKFRFLREGEPHGFYLEVAGGQFIEVFRGEVSSAPPSDQRIRHLCLQTDDLRGLNRRLKELGIDVTEPKLGADHSWQMWLKDPDGTEIEIHEYTAESTQRTGADCVVTW